MVAEALRVVVAEDSVLLREGLVRLLEEQGLRVTAAVGDGEALLRAVAEQVPDVCVVDVRMPPLKLLDLVLQPGVQQHTGRLGAVRLQAALAG